MAMRLTTRNKVFISGIIGAIVLFAGLYLLVGGPGSAAVWDDNVPEGFYLEPMYVHLLIASGLAAGIMAGLLLYKEKLAVVIVQSSTAGLATGVLAMLVYFAMAFAGLLKDGFLQATVDVLSGVVDISPFFIAIIITLTLLAAAGGSTCKLIMLAAGKLRPGWYR
jgi:hypothetical protein